jgi:GT2 family glycosyltransferase
MRIITIIVTYGDRFKFLEKVVSAVSNEGVSEIWLVDNASEEVSKKNISSLPFTFSNLKLFRNETNKGTAGAYSDILKVAFAKELNSFFWFLDDDNLPEQGSLKALCDAYSLLAIADSKLVLYSYRGNHWKDDFLAVSQGVIKGPKRDAFCGFDFFSYFKNKFLHKKIVQLNKEIYYPIVKVEYGPYGGLFSHIDNLKKIGLPKSEMFVYADDHEFTLRFSVFGIRQFLIYHSQIQDIDMSFNEGEGIFSTSISQAKLFYSFRNTTYFYKTIRKNNLKYSFNRVAFFLIISYWSFFKFLKSPKFISERVQFLFRAVRLGEKGIFELYS